MYCIQLLENEDLCGRSEQLAELLLDIGRAETLELDVLLDTSLCNRCSNRGTHQRWNEIEHGQRLDLQRLNSPNYVERCNLPKRAKARAGVPLASRTRNGRSGLDCLIDL